MLSVSVMVYQAKFDGRSAVVKR